MRQKRVAEQKPGVRKAQSKEPMAEGIQKERRHCGFFIRMSDEELISYAKKTVEEKGIRTRLDLQKADGGLYNALIKRKLLNIVIPEKQQRDWSISDKELISYAKKFIKENTIKTRSGLAKADGGLYDVLRRRKLLNIVLPKSVRSWSPMSDDELVDYAKRLVEEKNLANSNDLRKINGSLLNNLLKRKLVDLVFPDKRVCRNWKSLSDKQIIRYARDFVKKNEIKTRSALQKIDDGLYYVLWQRSLLDIVIPDKRGKDREWSKMSDEEVISYAENLIEKKGITIRSQLKDEDGTLYQVLYKRRLICSLLPRLTRRWSAMSDNEVISYSRDFMAENNIKNITTLHKADGGLYKVLLSRKLLNAVFADIEKSRKTAAVKQVVDAMKEFGGSK